MAEAGECHIYKELWWKYKGITVLELDFTRFDYI